jgi:hypothetical protein
MYKYTAISTGWEIKQGSRMTGRLFLIYIKFSRRYKFSTRDKILGLQRQMHSQGLDCQYETSKEGVFPTSTRWSACAMA